MNAKSLLCESGWSGPCALPVSAEDGECGPDAGEFPIGASVSLDGERPRRPMPPLSLWGSPIVFIKESRADALGGALYAP